MIRLRFSRPTLFLCVILLLAGSLLFLSPQGQLDHFRPALGRPAIPYDLGLPGQNSWLSFFSQGSSDLPGLVYGEDGLVRGWDNVHEVVDHGSMELKRKDLNRLKDVKGTHPIEVLMALGKDRWEALLARQSKTLPQAVSEYTRRYGRPPPKGFGEWWQFCKRNNVRIVDDYDQIFHDIEPYFAISPELFRRRVHQLSETKWTYRIDLSPGSSSHLTGDRSGSIRARRLFELLEPIAQFLPTDITFYGSDHDMGNSLLGDDQLQAAREMIKQGKHFTEMDLKDLEKGEGRREIGGLVSVCPEDSLAWNRSLALQNGEPLPPLRQQETSFIYAPRLSNDFCIQPENIPLHGAISFDTTRPNQWRPIFQYSKLGRNPEFLTVPLEAYQNTSSQEGQEKYAPWEEKTENKLFWRGSGTGAAYSKRKNYDWRLSHRTRLALMAQKKDGEESVWVQRGSDGKDWELEKWNVGKLNEAYFDIGMIGKPHQCDKKDGTCDEMAKEIVYHERVAPEQAVHYKYMLDVDGNGWSSRFHRLLASGSVTVKSTLYDEWNSDWLIPWYHYIPAKIDYSDLYSIMSFFIGSPEGRSPGHDELAKEIAENARTFALEFWRWEDMQAYMFRLLLEYARLAAPDREAASYHKSYT